MADLMGDHDLFHYEGEFMKNTHFKKPITNDFLLAGMSCHFGGDLFPGPGSLAESSIFKYLKPSTSGILLKLLLKL